MEEIKAERPTDFELTEAVVRGDSDAMAALRLKADPYSAAYTVGIVSVRPKQAIVAAFGWSKKGRRWSRNIGKSSRDRERRILELRFPSRIEKWFDMNRSNLPLVRGSEADIAAQRFFRIGMDRERR